jgi:hypothetical protein
MARFIAGLSTVAGTVLMLTGAASATPFSFSTGDVDGKIAAASRPSSGGKIEIESADDFVLGATTKITSASFTGLLTGGATPADIGAVAVEIYRVFPTDSAFPPSGHVLTRTNSPSDVAFDTRDTVVPNLTFSVNVLSQTFTALNSVLNGINPSPNSTTQGEGSVTGQEVLFNVTFTAPFDLPPDHYFFIPQVELSGADQEFFWLSSIRPIVAPGTPFAPDLQSWIRNEDLAPDWLRIGTDIVGPPPTGGPAPTFNAAFTLNGETVPEPMSLALLGFGLAGLGVIRRKRAA